MFKEKIRTVLHPSRTGVRRGVTVFLVVLLLFGGVGLTSSAERVSNLSDFNGVITATVDSSYSSTASINDDTVTFYFSDTLFVGTHRITYYFKTNNKTNSAIHQGFNGSFKYLNECCYNQYDGSISSLANFSIYAYYYDKEKGSNNYIAGTVKPQSWGYSFNFDSGELYIDSPIYYEIDVYVYCKSVTNQISFSFSEFEYIFETDEEIQTDELIESQKELQEQEKEEASQTGDDGVDSVTSAIPDYSGNILSAFQGFVDCFCHSNAEDLKLTMPEFNTPTFKGLISSFKIWDSFSVDFNTITEEYIPDKVLYLARFLLSTAILMWGIYEVYDLIEYFVTLSRKKGD